MRGHVQAHLVGHGHKAVGLLEKRWHLILRQLLRLATHLVERVLELLVREMRDTSGAQQVRRPRALRAQSRDVLHPWCFCTGSGPVADQREDTPRESRQLCWSDTG